MAGSDNEVRMMMSVYPGAMTGFAALQSGLVSINNVFMAMTRSMDQQFGLINTAIVTTGTVVTQLGIDAMNAFGEFEQGMKIVQMVSGQTTAEMNTLKQAANDFSVSYRMDIDQITEGLQTLGRAGLNSASEQSEVLKNGLNTAKLEGRDLNGVLEELIQNTALLGGNLKDSNFGEDSQYVNDLLVATSMTAPITTHDISETLKYSGGIAAAAGAQIRDSEGNANEKGKEILEDYMGAIAAFAQKGVTGSIAGTALRAFFNKPATQDSSVTEALASIKLKPEYLWEDDEETMKPVSQQIGIIQKQMDKLNISTMDRLQIWSKIVGGKMGQQMMKLDSESIKDITKDIRAADDATSLAQKSMQTYQANIKEVGEMGARLQRNVGGNLVQIANPILDIIVKIMEFAQSDVMSWPITGGIIAFIGMAGKKIMGVLSAVKAELSTLMTGLNAGLTYFTQKGGVVGTSPPRTDSEKEAARKAERDAYYSGKSSGKSFQEKGKKESIPTTLKDFDKQLSKSIKESGALTLKAFQQAGVSEKTIGLAGRLSNLTSAKNSLGVPEGQLWAAALKNDLLTKDQYNTMLKGYGSGLNARPMADLVGIEKVIPQIKASEQALKDLGLTASQLGWTEEERAAAEKFARQSIDETTAGIQREIEAETQNWVNKEAKIEAEKIAEQELIQKASQASAHTTALGTDVQITTEKIVMDVKIALSEVEIAFLQMAKNIKGFSSIPTGQTKPYDPQAIYYNRLFNNQSMPGNYTYRPYTVLPSNIHEMMNTAYVPHNVINQRAREIRANSLRAKDSANKARALEQAYNNPYIGKESTSEQRTARRIEDRLRGERLKNDFKEYNDAQASHYNRLFNKHVDNIRNTYQGAGVGGVSGRLPSKEAVQASIDANEEANRQARKAYVSRGSLPEGNSGLGRFGVGLNRDEINAFRDSAKRLAHRARSITKSHPDAITSGMGNFGLGKSDVQKIQKDAQKIASTTVRRVNDAIVNGASSGLKEKGVVSRNDINKMREDSRKQWQQARNQRLKYSMPQSNEVIPSNFEKAANFERRVQDRLKRLHQIQSEGGAYQKVLEEKSVAANTEARNYIKGGWGSNQALSYYNLNPSQLDKIAKAEEQIGKPGFGSAFYANLSDRLNRNRAGSFLSFGNTMVDGVMRSATKGLSGFANKALNATEAVGGPFMIAIMAASFAIQAWQKAFQDYCNDLKEAGDKLKEAYSNWNTAEEELEDSYKNANPDATQDEIEQMVLDTYSTMNEDMANAVNNGSEEWFKKIGKDRAETPTYEYNQEKDDGSVKLAEEQIDTETQLQEAIKSNTGALYEATSELNVAMSNYIRKGTDSWWGIDGWTGRVSDFFGQLSDSIAHKHTFAGSEETGGDNRFDSNNSKYSDNFEFLLTARQKDENYAGYTGMSGLMLQNWKDTGPYDKNSTENFLAGLQTMMGTDAITLRNVMSDGAKQFLDAESKFAKRLTQTDNLRIQQSMKNDSKTWKSLAKEIAKTEKKTGKKVDEKNKTKKIEGLIDKLNTSMGGHFSDTQILQAAYLTEMEGMLEVAKSTIVPIITQQAQLASQIMYSSLGTEQNVLGTGNSTYGTEQIASVIAAMVSQIALAQSAEATYNAILMQNPDDLDSGSLAAYRLAQDSKDANDFLKKAANASYSGGTVSINWGEALGAGAQDVLKAQNKGQLYAGVYSFSAEDNKKAMNDILTNFGMVGKMMNGWSRGDAQKDITKAINDWRDQGASSQQIYESLSKNFQTDKIKNMIADAYINSGEEEDGTGSGSGSGSGSGDKDKNTGNRKERVDLVLCNKKEIPKLNVNLFKKPPTFTVLNKNFKVRDVKINTEDTPKAIMSSIKNAFIDVQKRSDPKIIQDESAEYDPVAATDGNSLPSGTSKPNTS